MKMLERIGPCRRSGVPWGLGLWLALGGPVSGSEKPLANPFLTEEERQAAQQVITLKPPPVRVREPLSPTMRVTAIFYSPDPSKAIALVDGQIVRPGDHIANKRVVRIEPEAIVVADVDDAQNEEAVVPLRDLVTNP